MLTPIFHASIQLIIWLKVLTKNIKIILHETSNFLDFVKCFSSDEIEWGKIIIGYSTIPVRDTEIIKYSSYKNLFYRFHTLVVCINSSVGISRALLSPLEDNDFTLTMSLAT